MRWLKRILFGAVQLSAVMTTNAQDITGITECNPNDAGGYYAFAYSLMRGAHAEPMDPLILVSGFAREIGIGLTHRSDGHFLIRIDFEPSLASIRRAVEAAPDSPVHDYSGAQVRVWTREAPISEALAKSLRDTLGSLQPYQEKDPCARDDLNQSGDLDVCMVIATDGSSVRMVSEAGGCITTHLTPLGHVSERMVRLIRSWPSAVAMWAPERREDFEAEVMRSLNELDRIWPARQ